MFHIRIRSAVYRSASISLSLFAYCAVLSALSAADNDELLAGHSSHGEAFNEGPRQAAYIMPGMAEVSFPASTKIETAQRFINQGVAQLHGFWYYEAERSFRQAAVLDPDCAIAYWGMAFANKGNRERGQAFIQESVDRLEGVSEREKLYIKSLQQFFQDESKGQKIERKDRYRSYVSDLEEIVEEFPDDVEAKAFLAVHLWQSSRDLPIVSHVAVNSLLQEVFNQNPNHPAHHYRIHLWDRHKAKRALESAGLCGPSSPGIAHMWHMPGHIYDKLHRYHDAAWQQEASARVDHAHMMRDRVMPDQIHNFAHNNEWLIRNLVKVGRVQDALSLAENMLQLPRHPEYNTLQRGSTKYGRERLLLVLNKYRLWEKLIDYAGTTHLQPTADDKLQVQRLRALGVAQALSEHDADAEQTLKELEGRLATIKSRIKELEKESKDIEPKKEKKTKDKEQDKEEDKEEDKGEDKDNREEDAKDGKAKDVTQTRKDNLKAVANRERRKKELAKEIKDKKALVGKLEKAINAVKAARSAGSGDFEAALKHWAKSDWDDNLLKAEWMIAADKEKEALKLIEKELKEHDGEVLPLAVSAFVQFQLGNTEEAERSFVELQELAYDADLDTKLLIRLSPLAVALGHKEDWRDAHQVADDLGPRPSLESLGPFRWQPYLAPDFRVADVEDQELRVRDLRGKPTIVIFYLGFGCLHCIEQLHEFSPEFERFRETGIDIIAISTEDAKSLTEALDDYSNPLNIPLYANPDLHAFKAFRAFDDFEKQPLHGTFLIDPDGRVLWQDISYEPFMDVEFLFAESQRLLKLSGHGNILKSSPNESGETAGETTAAK